MVVVALWLAASGAHNGHAQVPIQQFLTETHVRTSLTVALENIHLGKCDTLKPCTPATAEELEKPPISLDEARAAVKAGVVSGMMQWCGLKWDRRNFRPFISHYRQALDMNARQLAVLAMMHRMHQNVIYSQLSKGNACSAAASKDMSRQMPLEELER